ncbi:MAG TPA: zf-HC2 domain-containing protein [Thermoanaerobaculia bacterium]|nr:zf-HC2 domain-containing protein [Thermoanaerobaculia bacterium]
MSEDSQQLANLRAAFTAPAVAAPAYEDCPSPETIWAAVRGELPPDALREVLDHTARCEACAEDWRLAVEVNCQAAAREEKTPGKLLVGRFGNWRPLAAAAALAAGLLVGVGVYRGAMVPNQPTYRETQQPEIRSLLPAAQALPRQGAVLRWSPVPGAASYDVSVSTEDLRQLATIHGQTAAAYPLPPAALTTLPAGAKILWQVEAVFPDGHRVTSPTFTSPVQ